MRHGKKVNHLSRKSGHRKAMLANMTVSLIEHKRITTTVAKAKALRMYAEPIITKAKNDTTHSRRIVFSYLKNKDAVNELFREVAPKIADRPGGYLRIIKTGARLGDNAEMCLIELVDFNELYSLEKKPSSKKRSRRGRGGKKKTETAATENAAEATEVATEDAPKAEAPATETEAPAEAKNEAKAEDKPEAPAEKKADDAKEGDDETEKKD